MTLKTRAIPDDVAAILRRSTYEGDRLILPGTLDRADYQRVNKAIEGIGGVWNRAAKAHVFRGQAHELVAAALDAGGYVDDRLNGYFPTPDWLADSIVQRAGVAPGHEVLEPSAGEGAIADAVRRAVGVSPTCVELDRRRVLVLAGKSYEVLGVDFLALPVGWRAFDRVVMNPPFAKGQDVQHVRHAYAMLRPGGRLIAVMAAGFTFREDRASVEFRAMVEECGSWEPLPPGIFREAGTDVNTVLVEVRA